MCGIFFSLGASEPILPNKETCSLLRNRGPDSFQVHQVTQDAKSSIDESVAVHLTFVSTVLSMRGDHVVSQPLVDDTTQSVLCWNGDAWKIAGNPIQGNDTELIFKLFLEAVQPRPGQIESQSAVRRLQDVISSVSGPFAFVFYDAVNSRVFFSRDCLGRRSLLQGVDGDGNFKICSLCDSTSATHFEEVGSDGVYMIDSTRTVLDTPGLSDSNGCFNIDSIQILPWGSASIGQLVCFFLFSPFSSFPVRVAHINGQLEKFNPSNE